MRRMVKENLLKFDGTPLFPERIAYTVPYKLSAPEATVPACYGLRARGIQSRGGAPERQAAGTVGFALTILHRRLALHPKRSISFYVDAGSDSKAGCATRIAAARRSGRHRTRRRMSRVLERRGHRRFRGGPRRRIEAAEEKYSTKRRPRARFRNWMEIETLKQLEDAGAPKGRAPTDKVAKRWRAS